MHSHNYHEVPPDDLGKEELARQTRFPLLVCTNSDCLEPPYCGFEGDVGQACFACSIRDPQTGRILQPRGIRQHKYYVYD